MTDKEIMNNGVDVSECRNYDCNQFWECKLFTCHCYELPSCSFKRFKRKEQECEKLKKEKAEIKKYLGISSKTIMQRLEELQERKDKLSVREYNYKQALDDIEYQVRELFLGVENKDRPYCGNILDIINKAKEA